MLYHSQWGRKVENNNKINDVLEGKNKSISIVHNFISDVTFLLRHASKREKIPFKWIFMQKQEMSQGDSKIKYIGVCYNKRAQLENNLNSVGVGCSAIKLNFFYSASRYLWFQNMGCVFKLCRKYVKSKLKWDTSERPFTLSFLY